VKGGREGLFMPIGERPDSSPLLVAEGVTDTGALLDMGFVDVIGRPSAAGGIKLLVELVRARRFPEVVIVADADTAGRQGASNLASMLVAYTRSVRVIEPPEGIKDVRDWWRAGGQRLDVEQRVADAAVRRLVIQTRRVQHGR
jgi:DNA primase